MDRSPLSQPPSPTSLKPTIRFSLADVKALDSKFVSYCKNGKMKIEEFRSMLGILGLENASFICDRLFAVISNKSDEVGNML